MQTKSHHVLPVFVADHSSSTRASGPAIPSSEPGISPTASACRQPISSEQIGHKNLEERHCNKSRGNPADGSARQNPCSPNSNYSRRVRCRKGARRKQNLLPGPFRVAFLQEGCYALVKIFRRADPHILFHRRNQLPVQLFAGERSQQPLRRQQRCRTVF